MIEVTRYAMQNGARFNDRTQELSLFAACGALAKFLAVTDTVCHPLTEKPTELELWGMGPMYDEFVIFRGSEEEMAGIYKMLKLNLERDYLREALVERLKTLSRLLEMRISPRMPNGVGTRHLSLMLMSGNANADDYEHLPFLVANLDELVAALELWMEEQACGRQTPLFGILRPTRKAA
ncbi:MAG: hypothetical protein IT343_14630 [Candidatus Melainabacteria bacterium]|jgi:hypothetical protein|nr:hypothetical protein [Candidatus Melainabacteria bacterium]